MVSPKADIGFMLLTPDLHTANACEKRLTLSLGPSLSPQIFGVTGIKMGVNYGANKVRFPAPVPVGSKLRLGAKLLGVEDVAGGVQVTMEFVFEVEGASKPSCVAECVFRYYV